MYIGVERKKTSPPGKRLRNTRAGESPARAPGKGSVRVLPRLGARQNFGTEFRFSLLGHGVYRCITDPGSGSVPSVGISPGSEGSGVPPPRGSPGGGGSPDPGGEGRIGYETVRRTRDPK